MSNNIQINSNPNNKLRVNLLKQEWVKLRMNLECVESCEKEISELENTQTPISIKDPYHPNHDYYNSQK